MDVTALEEAGFTKKLSDEEWQDYQAKVAARYLRGNQSTPNVNAAPGGQVAADYVLERGDVLVSTEQNTQDQVIFGNQTTIRYPEIAVIENQKDGRRVTCASSDTQLILALADEIVRPIGSQPR